MEIVRDLKTLDPEVGDPELVKSVEVQLARFSSELAEWMETKSLFDSPGTMKIDSPELKDYGIVTD